MNVITSRDNKWLKSFRSVLRGSGPSTGEPIGVEGPKLVEDALRSGLQADALLVSESADREAESILRIAAETETGISRSRILRTTDKLFQSVAATDAPQGVAALFRQRVWGLEDVLRGPGEMRQAPALVIVLAEVQDPGNVGTTVRSAEALGATGVVSTRGTADPWSPKALRASAGAALRLPILRGMAIPVLLAQLRIAGVKIYASSAASDEVPERVYSVEEANLREPTAIFIGNEGAGLSAEVKRAADAVITILISKNLESLNAGVAASIILYEAAKQRQSEAQKLL
ncbi:MAG: TrmH family RNA methyltransferase [Candidatus Acidiferrales bacterium]